jgi:hypothetical protein
MAVHKEDITETAFLPFHSNHTSGELYCVIGTVHVTERSQGYATWVYLKLKTKTTLLP